MPRCSVWTSASRIALAALCSTAIPLSAALNQATEGVQPSSPAAQQTPIAPSERVLSTGQAIPHSIGDEYVLGPGDRLTITIHTREPRFYQPVVSPTGELLIEWLDPLHVAGSTLGEVRERLTRALRRLYRNADISVTLSQLRTFRVWLWGEVRKPGAYIVDPLMSVSDLIALSDALMDSSSLRRVVLRRGDTQRRVDLERILLGGDTKDDVRLEPGDAVFVPVRGPAVIVEGEVRRAAIYELEPGETVQDVLNRAGGATAQAALEHAYLERARPQESHVALDLSPEGPPADQAKVLRDGDRLVIPSLEEFLGSVVLTGEFVALKEQPAPVQPPSAPSAAAPQAQAGAKRPATPAPDATSGGGPSPVGEPSLTIPVRPGLTLLDAINQAGGVTAEASLEHATLTRAEGGKVVSVPVDFVALIRHGDISRNVELRDGDVITVPSLRLFQGEVRISGQLRRLVGLPATGPKISSAEGWVIERPAGKEPVLRCPLRRGMRLKDLIDLAGGPTADASLQHAIVDRPTPTGSTQLLAVDFDALLRKGDESQNIPLKDGDRVQIPSRATFEGQVYVLGEVHGAIASPDKVFQTSVREGMKISDLLEIAGGPTPQADLRYAFVLTHDEDGKQIKKPIDLAPIWNDGSSTGDRIIKDGDHLYVPSIALRQNTIRVVGSFVGANLTEVQGAAEAGGTGTAPGIRAAGDLYPTPGGDQVGILAIGKGETVGDVIRRLGGVSPKADTHRARVERKMPDGSTRVFPIDLHKLLVANDPTADLELQNGDTLVVPQLANQVFALDQFNTPGAFPYRVGLTLSQLIGLAGGLTDHAKPKSAVILRADPSGKTVPLPVNLEKILSGQTDVEVQPGDAVFVPRQTFKTIQDYASVIQSLAGLYFLFR